MKNYFDQAEADYEGKIVRFAEYWDDYNEHHIIIEMSNDSDVYWLVWIGGEHAKFPDEFDQLPFDNLSWNLYSKK